MLDHRNPVVTAAKAWMLGAVTLAGSGALAAGMGVCVQVGMAWLGMPIV